MSSRDLNRYEKEIVFPVVLCKVLCALYVLFNAVIPTYSGMQLGFSKPYWIVSSALAIMGLLGCMGLISQIAPLAPMIIIRIIQFALERGEGGIYFIPFIILILVDIFYNMYLMVDRSTYEYIEVSEFEEE